MPCECSANKKLDNNNKFTNNKILSLDSMASMSIDKIVDLYKDGYRLEDALYTPSIKSMQTYSSDCSLPATWIVRSPSQVGGFMIYRGFAGACKIVPTSRCLDNIWFTNVRRPSGSHNDIHFEIREDSGGLPNGAPRSSTGLLIDKTVPYSNISTTASTLIVDFTIILPTTNVPYWIVVYSSDYGCSSTWGTGTTNERIEFSRSLTGSNITYYSAPACQWQSVMSDSWAIEAYMWTYSPPVFTTINITPTAPSINIGSTQQFTASCLDQRGNPYTCPTLTWSSVGGLAPINSSGLATGNGAGTSNISCTGGGKTSNTAILTVVKVVYSITISPLTASLTTGGTQQLTAVCRDIGGNPLPSCPPLTWYTTNSSVATVNSSGLVTAGSTPGTANISCTGGGSNSTASSVITVIGPLNTITISPTPVSLNIGATQQLVTVCKDAGNTVITCPTLAWISDNPTVAIVNSSGLVTAVSSGTANMSCSGGTKTSNLSIVTVISPANITMQNITVGGVPCIGGCSITCSMSCPTTVNIVVTWSNSGGSSGTFTPTVTIAGGFPITGSQITVASGGTGTTTFSGVSLPQGTPNVCVNTGTIT